ncbi:AI-2E family transporter [Synechococcus sp. CS-1325]|uniref:AI-2E family transporter n=1 Tax=unclassified Synechococcus TaxID=2626047 RepID=UPI000DB7213B|nr:MULTISPECIES: AI-2E family transporter [unclassified Synechococcus]PZV02110.1 MAG: AI-2E family transporter [Cyanobium sp.]MCT0198646.1 AI-2E family transporter [Synechococcus sp. CS-1325]MCT0212759.1 AI-2E family transporter [Synechococcus sp. CS-1326]MCT0230024.1 AI-2E family transporter [Synechococcus sp. CS-1324]MCT0232591.1 AI-2E family transporter [Synechococcus sp. CS-1327]
MNREESAPWASINNSNLVRFLLLFACGWAGVALIAFFYPVLSIFILAAILAVLMDYPVRFLTAWLPRWLAIVIVCIGVVSVLTGSITILGFQLLNQGSSLINDLLASLKDSDFPFHSYFKQLNIDQIITVIRTSFGTGFGVLGGAVANLFTAIILPVITIYMLADGTRLWTSLLGLVPIDHREGFDRSVQKNVLGFLRGQMTLVLFLSVTSFLIFALLGVKFSLVLALVVGVLDAIPGIGAILGVITITSLVLLTQGPWMALSVVVASIILQQIQDNLIHPRVMGKALNISPVVVFFALFIGERVAGLLGVFLAIPIAGMIVGWPEQAEAQPRT